MYIEVEGIPHVSYLVHEQLTRSLHMDGTKRGGLVEGQNAVNRVRKKSTNEPVYFHPLGCADKTLAHYIGTF